MSQANPSAKEIDDYAQAWMTNGNDQTKAWRVTFPKSKAIEKSQHENACLFHKIPKVRSRIRELRMIASEKADETFGVTAESLIKDLQDIQKAALNEKQFAPSVSAVMGQAKLAGLDVQKIDVTSKGDKLKSFGDFYE